MAKCFFTCVEQPTGGMFILDITAARKAIRDLKSKIASVEHIIRQLHGREAAEVYNPKTKKTNTLMFYRLIAPTIAHELSKICPEASLFIPWCEHKARRREFYSKRSLAKISVKNGISEDTVSNEAGCDV